MGAGESMDLSTIIKSYLNTILWGGGLSTTFFFLFTIDISFVFSPEYQLLHQSIFLEAPCNVGSTRPPTIYHINSKLQKEDTPRRLTKGRSLATWHWSFLGWIRLFSFNANQFLTTASRGTGGGQHNLRSYVTCPRKRRPQVWRRNLSRSLRRTDNVISILSVWRTLLRMVWSLILHCSYSRFIGRIRRPLAKRLMVVCSTPSSDNIVTYLQCKLGKLTRKMPANQIACASHLFSSYFYYKKSYFLVNQVDWAQRAMFESHGYILQKIVEFFGYRYL